MDITCDISERVKNVVRHYDIDPALAGKPIRFTRYEPPKESP